jgi:hypothetical protein
MTEQEPLPPHQWDIETDVVVAGFGVAGSAASVTATEPGATVRVLEKAQVGQHGGNTRVADQGYLSTSSADKAGLFAGAMQALHCAGADGEGLGRGDVPQQRRAGKAKKYREAARKGCEIVSRHDIGQRLAAGRDCLRGCTARPTVLWRRDQNLTR